MHEEKLQPKKSKWVSASPVSTITRWTVFMGSARRSSHTYFNAVSSCIVLRQWLSGIQPPCWTDMSVFFLRSPLYLWCSSKMNEKVVCLLQCYCQSGHDLSAHAPSQCCHDVSFLTPAHNAHLIQQTGNLDPFASHAGSPVPLLFPPARRVRRTSRFPFK